MSNPVRPHFTRSQSESMSVALLSFSVFQSIWGRRGRGGGRSGLYHPLPPTFLCSFAQVRVNSLLQLRLASLLRGQTREPVLRRAGTGRAEAVWSRDTEEGGEEEGGWIQPLLLDEDAERTETEKQHFDGQRPK